MKCLSFIVLLSLALGSACSPEKQVEYAEDPSAATPENTAATRRKLQYETKLSAKSASLKLADATTFTMTLSGCLSSQTATVDETSIYLEVYEFDRNCVVKLTTFKLNGKDYSPKAGSLFNNWAVGDTAVFTAGAGDDLKLEVISTVANPVVANGAVEYEFSEIVAGSDKVIDEATVRESATLKVGGQDAPNFTINKVTLVDVTATGNGEFRFQMDCGRNVALADALDPLSLACYDVRLADIRLALVENTGFTFPLIEDDLVDIFTAVGGGKTIDMSTNTIAVGGGSPVVPHGGFITGAKGQPGSMVMPGTLPLEAHPNMLLVLKAGNSYLYFKVDVEVIVQGP